MMCPARLAREMIALLAFWLPQRTICIVGDSEYAGKSISRHLPPNVHLTSPMVMNSALCDPPPKRRKRQRCFPVGRQHSNGGLEYGMRERRLQLGRLPNDKVTGGVNPSIEP